MNILQQSSCSYSILCYFMFEDEDWISTSTMLVKQKCPGYIDEGVDVETRNAGEGNNLLCKNNFNLMTMLTKKVSSGIYVCMFDIKPIDEGDNAVDSRGQKHTITDEVVIDQERFKAMSKLTNSIIVTAQNACPNEVSFGSAKKHKKYHNEIVFNSPQKRKCNHNKNTRSNSSNSTIHINDFFHSIQDKFNAFISNVSSFSPK